MTIDLGDYINGIPMGAMAPGSSSGGGGGETGNYVTLDTSQTISGYKIFDSGLQIRNTFSDSHSERIDTSINTTGYVAFVFNAGGGTGAEVGAVLATTGQNVMFITPSYDAQTLYINNYSDGSSTDGVADKVQIAGSLVNKCNGVEYDVLNSSTGILYRALTDAEYTALETKSENTMYRITDTGKVYLGETDISGGSAAVMTTQAGLGLGAENTGYVGTTTVTVTNPDEEVV